ncbi:MAG: hypothetical protein ACRELD_08280 [Longimicrobiales bacterium]
MMHEMRSPRRARLLGAAILSAAFLVGGLVGATVTRAVSATEGAPQPRSERPERNDRGPDLFDQLELTPEQRVRVDSILERRRAQMEAFWDSHRSQVRGIYDSTRLEIRAVLTPAQREVEERIRAERKAYHEKRGRDGERGRGGRNK